MAKGRKNATKVGNSPQATGDMRSMAMVRNLTFKDLLPPLKDIGPGQTDENNKNYMVIDLSKNHLEDYVGAVFSILSHDLNYPGPSTIVKLEELLLMTDECHKGTTGEVRKQYIFAKKKMKNFHKYFHNCYFNQTPPETLRIHMLNFIINFGDELGFDIGPLMKHAGVK